MEKFRSFIVKLIVMSAILVAISYFLFTQYLEEYYLPVFPYLLGFFMVVTSVVHFFHLKAQESKDSVFARYAIGVNGAKIFLYLLFILFYVFFQRDTAVSFLFGFFALYVIFNIFEVTIYQKIIRKK